MALPEAIQRQVDAADEIEKQLAQGQATPPSETANQQPETPPQPAEPQQAEPQVAPATATQEPPAVSEETWERRYHTLQTKYNAEVPRLHEQTRHLQGALTQMQDQLKALEAKLTEKPAQPEPAKPSVTDKDVAAFGPELIDLQRRVAAEVMEAVRQEQATELSKRDTYIAQLEAKLGMVSTKQAVSDQDRFYGALATAVPAWETINTSEHFLRWLGEVDPVYGATRDEALQAAYQRLDSTRVIAIFQAYEKAFATPPQQQSAPNSELQQLQQPTRQRTPANQEVPAGQKRVWFQHEITKFYDDWRRGEIKPEDAVRIEAEIDAAVAEGRVR